METILFFDTKDYEKTFFEKNLFNDYNLMFREDSLNQDTKTDTREENSSIISVFTGSRLTKDVLQRFNNLKLILTRSVGYSHIDTDYCQEKGIIVANTPHYGDYTVAEFSFGILLNFARRICYGVSELKQGDMYPVTFGMELFDKTIGIIGTGSIGSKSVKIAKGFSMNVLCYDVKENEELKADYEIKYVDMAELCKLSDIIMLHAPLTTESYHIIDKNMIDKMKDNVIIVNTARGELIDTEALYDALLEKRIRGAAVDVLEFEETISNKRPGENLNLKNLRISLINTKLLNSDNIIVTPHIAYDTKEAVHRILDMTLSNIYEYKNNTKITNMVK